jgi:hypothetical protein
MHCTTALAYMLVPQAQHRTVRNIKPVTSKFKSANQSYLVRDLNPDITALYRPI